MYILVYCFLCSLGNEIIKMFIKKSEICVSLSIFHFIKLFCIRNHGRISEEVSCITVLCRAHESISILSFSCFAGGNAWIFYYFKYFICLFRNMVI